MKKHKNILYAVFTNDDLDKLCKELTVGINDNVTIHIYYVIKAILGNSLHSMCYLADDSILNIEFEKQEKAKQKLKSLFAKPKFKNISWSVDVVDSPKNEIIDKACELKADVIYLNGQKNKTIFKKLNSIENYIINKSGRDVVILQP